VHPMTLGSQTSSKLPIQALGQVPAASVLPFSTVHLSLAPSGRGNSRGAHLRHPVGTSRALDSRQSLTLQAAAREAQSLGTDVCV
jgi:hypothetical protein